MDALTGRQDFDMVALMSLVKDIQPNQMALIVSQMQAGNQAVIAAVQHCDKAALYTALGIEKSLGEAKNDIQRDICSSTQAISTIVNILGNKVDCGFRDVAKELCDVRMEVIKSGYETQLRDMENMHKLALLARDGQDATYEENHKTRALIRASKLDDLRDKNNALECAVRQFEDQKFVREAVCDELLIHRRRGGGRWFDDDCDDDFGFHHGRHGRHGCDDDLGFHTRSGRCGRTNVEVNVHEQRRRRDRDDDDHGHGHDHD